MAVSRPESILKLAGSVREAEQGRRPARLRTALNPPPAADSEFFRLSFGTAPEAGSDPAIVHVPLRLLGAAEACESWFGPEVLARGFVGDVATVTTDEFALLHASASVGDDPAPATQDIYRRLLASARSLGYAELVRAWNFVPGINRGSGDAERYVRFNAGRAAAFDQSGLDPASYPAGTAVGSPSGSPLMVALLASRRAALAIENPRQISAHLYPRQYGPRPPAFVRATLLPHDTGGMLFISGTASIIGHGSRHAGITDQLEETFRNLDCIVAAAQVIIPGGDAVPRSSLRVYLRDPADLPVVERRVRRRLADGDAVVFLQADICRRELLVEIEGTCELGSAAW